MGQIRRRKRMRRGLLNRSLSILTVNYDHLKCYNTIVTQLKLQTCHQGASSCKTEVRTHLVHTVE